MTQAVVQPERLHDDEHQTDDSPNIVDDDIEMNALWAELEAQNELLMHGGRNVPITEKRPDSLDSLKRFVLSLPDDPKPDLMEDLSRPTLFGHLQEAKDVIGNAMTTTKSESAVSIATATKPVEPAPTISAKVGTRAAAARFSIFDIRAMPTIINPREHLAALIEELRVHRDYRRVRDEYCQLSILINLEGLVAPAFRPQPKIGMVQGSPIYFEIHRDQLVIDCHWLHCRREPIVTRDEKLLPLFDLDETFPFELAREFAEQVWTKKHRIDQLLVLTPRQQCQLATLRGKNVEGRFEASLKGLGKGHSRVPPKVTAVQLKLYEWAERNKGVRRLLKDYENLWLARELLGNTAPIRQVAELFALVSGKPKLAEKTVKGKLETLDKHIGGTK